MSNIAQTAQITDTVKMVDHISLQSDRWLFIMALVIIIGGCALAIRWLVNALEKKDDAQKEERIAMHERMDADKDAFIKALAIRDEQCRDHTAALNRLTDVLDVKKTRIIALFAAILISGCSVRQPDGSKVIVGPSVSATFTEEGFNVGVNVLFHRED